MTIDDVFAVGSWWVRQGQLVVAGRVNPQWPNSHAAARNVYLYPIPQDAGPIPMATGFLTLDRAIALVISGDIRPCVPNDLGAWSEAEQAYYRDA